MSKLSKLIWLGPWLAITLSLLIIALLSLSHLPSKISLMDLFLSYAPLFIFSLLLLPVIIKASKITTEIISGKKSSLSKFEIWGFKIARCFFILALIVGFWVDINTDLGSIHGDALGGFFMGIIFWSAIGFAISVFLILAPESKKIWHLLLGCLLTGGLTMLFGGAPLCSLILGLSLILALILRSAFVLVMLIIMNLIFFLKKGKSSSRKV